MASEAPEPESVRYPFDLLWGGDTLRACCICKKEIPLDNDGIILSREMPDRLVCNSCQLRLKRLRMLAKSGDYAYPKASSETKALFGQYDCDDDVLEFLQRYLRKADRTYRDICREHACVNESVPAQSTDSR